MGYFLDLYNKHPEKGKQYYHDRACARGASIAIQRNFGESFDDFLARRPDLAEQVRELREDRDALS